ncbi:hypothetical protein [Azospirillum brasilense]|uniref:hypothetical protein n=1 Tax=Azospirillum brasilense TaxID=192 RepID=UPI0010C0799E|nr:hypothetical protein [Azospirillum brasilense]
MSEFRIPGPGENGDGLGDDRSSLNDVSGFDDVPGPAMEKAGWTTGGVGDPLFVRAFDSGRRWGHRRTVPRRRPTA